MKTENYALQIRKDKVKQYINEKRFKADSKEKQVIDSCLLKFNPIFENPPNSSFVFF